MLRLRLWELRMPRTGWTPSIVSIVPSVPYGADQMVYLVVDSFGRLGTAYRETDIERTDLETVITDLISGQLFLPEHKCWDRRACYRATVEERCSVME